MIVLYQLLSIFCNKTIYINNILIIKFIYCNITCNFRENYSKLVHEAILINVIGLLLILFGGLSVYLVTQEHYKRFAKLEDEALVNRTQ